MGTVDTILLLGLQATRIAIADMIVKTRFIVVCIFKIVNCEL